MNVHGARYTVDRLRYAYLRHQLRSRIEVIFHDLTANIDPNVFADKLRPFWEPLPGAASAKYLALETWLREAILRYLISNDGINASGKVVDLGSGAGYFLWVCREHGHEVMGLDIFDDPLYDAFFEFFSLPRIEYRIEALRPIYDFGGNASLITAFMTCFDRFPNGRPWDTSAWTFFLSDIRERLQPGGRLVIKFNADLESGFLYLPAIAQLFSSHKRYRSRALLDYVFFDAI